jgi:capsular polysaccharide export protein
MDATQRLHRAIEAHSGLKALWTIGFSMRKRGMLKLYLSAFGLSAYRVHGAQQPDCALLAWGAKPVSNCLARVEDGFIRSVGLGADLTRPLSWVFDTRGIYFDATQPSDLEWLLQNKQFSLGELERAAALRRSVIAAGLTKYNVGAGVWQRPTSSKRVVLVVGQVETDASIRLGSHTVQTNADLLQAVRKLCPQDYLIYKPHPDVLVGLRSGNVLTSQALQWCDEVVTDADMADLLTQVDALHVMTSLAGFEALLRGVAVTCHGTPFYAGWGLCNEPHVLPAAQARRTRRLTLDQLVAGALIDYPSYLHPEQDVLMTAEQAVEFLKIQRKNLKKTSYITKLKRFALACIAKLQDRF